MPPRRRNTSVALRSIAACTRPSRASSARLQLWGNLWRAATRRHVGIFCYDRGTGGERSFVASTKNPKAATSCRTPDCVWITPTGLALNLIVVVLLVLAMYTLGLTAWGIELGKLPEWATTPP